jgi:hypothetical protein
LEKRKPAHGLASFRDQIQPPEKFSQLHPTLAGHRHEYYLAKHRSPERYVPGHSGAKFPEISRTKTVQKEIEIQSAKCQHEMEILWHGTTLGPQKILPRHSRFQEMGFTGLGPEPIS